MSFLKVSGKDIVDEGGRKVYLRGVNLGNWLLLEGYFFHGRNFGAQIFKRNFVKHNGKEALKHFLSTFRQNYISYQDIRRIKKMGANVIRLPFNYRLLYKEKRWDYLNRAISWCKKEGIRCILDLHAAPGAQNPDWHGDSDGKARLWKDKKNRDLLVKIWGKIAQRYKDEPTIAGYDVLNESVTKNSKLLKKLYARITEEIRKFDKRHILFFEGNHYAQNLSFLGKPKDENTAYSIHVYLPLSFTFNLEPHLKYPGAIEGKKWDRKRIMQMVESYHRFSEKWNVPIYVGEFGVTFRSAKDYGELNYLNDLLSAFKKYNFHWTYWSYKCIANTHFPDGIWQYLPNPAWVKREGPIFGWENFYFLWKKHKKKIASSWKTKKFSKNKYISKLLHRYMQKKGA